MNPTGAVRPEASPEGPVSGDDKPGDDLAGNAGSESAWPDDASADDGEAFEAQARLALQALDELDGGKGVSLPRLAKRTGLRVSVLLRLFTLLSDARVGEQAGPGWVHLRLEEDGRWMASLTPAGRGEPGPAGPNA